VCLCVQTVTCELSNLWSRFVPLVRLGTAWLIFEGQDHRSKFRVAGEKVTKVVGATSSEGFLVASVYQQDHTLARYSFAEIFSVRKLVSLGYRVALFA